VYNKLARVPDKLGDKTHLFVGLQTDADDVFILEELERKGDKVLCQSKSTGERHWFEDFHLKPFLKGSLNIRRYHLSNVTKRLIFPYELKDGKSALIEAGAYHERFPLTWSYLEQNKERLAKRNKGRMGESWYGYVYKKNHTRFNNPKLLVPSIATGSSFAPDLEGKYYFVGSGGGGGGGYGITAPGWSPGQYLYLLGLLNSKMMAAFLKLVDLTRSGGHLRVWRQSLRGGSLHAQEYRGSLHRGVQG